MTGDDNRAVIRLQRRFECFDGFDIKVVARFIQQQKLARLAVSETASQSDPHPLSTAEQSDLLIGVIAAKQEARERGATVVLARLGIKAREGLTDGFLRIKKTHFLIDESERYVDRDRADLWLQRAFDTGQQCGFTRAIRAVDCQTLRAMDGDGNIGEERAVFTIPKRDVVHVQDLSRAGQTGGWNIYCERLEHFNRFLRRSQIRLSLFCLAIPQTRGRAA